MSVQDGSQGSVTLPSLCMQASTRSGKLLAAEGNEHVRPVAGPQPCRECGQLGLCWECGGIYNHRKRIWKFRFLLEILLVLNTGSPFYIWLCKPNKKINPGEDSWLLLSNKINSNLLKKKSPWGRVRVWMVPWPQGMAHGRTWTEWGLSFYVSEVREKVTPYCELKNPHAVGNDSQLQLQMMKITCKWLEQVCQHIASHFPREEFLPCLLHPCVHSHLSITQELQIS